MGKKAERRKSEYNPKFVEVVESLVTNIDGYISEFEDGTVHVRDGISLEEERRCVSELRKMIEKLKKGKYEGIIRDEVLDANRRE